MKYILDTDMCSYIIKDFAAGLQKRFEKIKAGDISISSLTWAELYSWVSQSSQPEKRLLSLQKMFAPISILPFTDVDASFHGRIRTELKSRGQLIGALNMLITAHAVSRNLILVTNNVDHFKRVSGLKVENWLV